MMNNTAKSADSGAKSPFFSHFWHHYRHFSYISFRYVLVSSSINIRYSFVNPPLCLRFVNGGRSSSLRRQIEFTTKDERRTNEGGTKKPCNLLYRGNVSFPSILFQQQVKRLYLILMTLQYILSYTAVPANRNSSTSRMKLKYQLCNTEVVLGINAFVLLFFSLKYVFIFIPNRSLERYTTLNKVFSCVLAMS